MQFLTSIVYGFILVLSTVSAEPKITVPPQIAPHDHKSEGLQIFEPSKLPGTLFGFCGAWAVAVQARILHWLSGEPTLDEWEETTDDLGVDRMTGGVSVEDLTSYYTRRGYKVEFVDIKPNDCNAQYYAAHKLDENDVVMILMFNNLVGGHVETVVGVESCVIETNSWGVEGHITYKNRFNHTHMTMFNIEGVTSVLLIAKKI